MQNFRRQQHGFILPMVMGFMALAMAVSAAAFRDSEIAMRMGATQQRIDLADELSKTGIDYVRNRITHSRTAISDLNGNGKSDLEDGVMIVSKLQDWESDNEIDLHYAFLNTHHSNKPLQNYELLQKGHGTNTSCTENKQDLEDCASLKIDKMFMTEYKPLLYVNTDTGFSKVTTTWNNTNTEQKVAVFLDYSIHPHDNEKVNVYVVSVAQVHKAVAFNWRYLGYYKIIGYDDDEPEVSFFKASQYDTGLNDMHSEEH